MFKFCFMDGKYFFLKMVIAIRLEGRAYKIGVGIVRDGEVLSNVRETYYIFISKFSAIDYASF